MRRTDTVNSKDPRGRSKTARSLSRARKLAASIKDNFLNGVDAIAGIETEQLSRKSSNRRGPPPAAGDRYKEVFHRPPQSQRTEMSRTPSTRSQQEDNRPQLPVEVPRPRLATLTPGQPFPLNSATSPALPARASQRRAPASSSSAQPRIQSLPVHQAYRSDPNPARTHRPRTSSFSSPNPQPSTSGTASSTSLPRLKSISRSKRETPAGTYLADQIHAPRSPGIRRTDRRIPERNQSPIRYLYPEHGYYERPRRDGDDAGEDGDWRDAIDDEYADERGRR